MAAGSAERVQQSRHEQRNPTGGCVSNSNSRMRRALPTETDLSLGGVERREGRGVVARAAGSRRDAKQTLAEL